MDGVAQQPHPVRSIGALAKLLIVPSPEASSLDSPPGVL
jgi:hypothetical protein